MSRHCQRRKGVQVERLDRFDSREQVWREMLVEDRGAGPAETAAARLDFAAFLQTLTEREREIALTLAQGESTGAAARRFQLSAARISQVRRELLGKWRAFQGDLPTITNASA